MRDRKVDFDVLSNDGVSVEVKTIILDMGKSRSPVIRVKKHYKFDALCIVLFSPNLDIETAKIIPSDAISFYSQFSHKTKQEEMLNIRVTPDFLEFPGSRDVAL